MPVLLTVQQSADALGCSTRTIEDLCRRGELESLFLGNGRLRRVPEEAIAAFIAERVQQGSRPC